MGARVVEETILSGRFGRPLRLRIDLHGISVFGPGPHHCLIRWEWITRITPGKHGVLLESPKREILLPAGAFGLEPAAMADRLEQAGSIFKRADILEELGGGAERGP